MDDFTMFRGIREELSRKYVGNELRNTTLSNTW